MSATTKTRATRRAGIEQLLHERLEAGKRGMRVSEIAEALTLERDEVREIIKNLKRTGRVKSTQVEANPRAPMLYVINPNRPMPKLGPLTVKARDLKPLGSLTPSRTAEIVHPPEVAVQRLEGAVYARLGPYTVGAPVRAGSRDHERHGSQRGSGLVPFCPRPVPIFGGAK
jgi:DNA-binding Lrp family transcriptional regulator